MHDDEGPALGTGLSRRVLPALTISVADRDYTVYPDDAVVTIGRALPEDSHELPAQIQVDDPRISRTHVRIDCSQDSWLLTDPGSFNGTFIDGRQVRSVPVKGALTVHLGNANGVVVQLNTAAVQSSGESRAAVERHEQHDESTEALTPTVQTAVTIDDARITLRRIRTTALPPTSDPDYHHRVNVLLAQLRRHANTISAHLSRAPGRPEVGVSLSDVRLAYVELTLKAASAPGATLGQRLYAARHAGLLSADEIASAAGVTAEDIATAEADLPVTESVQAAIEAVVDALVDRVGDGL